MERETKIRILEAMGYRNRILAIDGVPIKLWLTDSIMFVLDERKIVGAEKEVSLTPYELKNIIEDIDDVEYYLRPFTTECCVPQHTRDKQCTKGRHIYNLPQKTAILRSLGHRVDSITESHITVPILENIFIKISLDKIELVFKKLSTTNLPTLKGVLMIIDNMESNLFPYSCNLL